MGCVVRSRCVWSTVDSHAVLVRVQGRARELHALITEEQGGHCEFSVGELEEMMNGADGVPAHLLAFRTVRCATLF